jgi:hypothetical protein
MAVNVFATKDSRLDDTSYPNATGFTFDDKNNLQVTNGYKQVAAWAPGSYAKAEVVQDEPVTDRGLQKVITSQ